jgi:hypothetical protein
MGVPTSLPVLDDGQVDEIGPPPHAGWSPTDSQRELLQLLRERSDEIGGRFEGALRACADRENPDALAQAALSVREVFDDFGLVMRVPLTVQTFKLGDEVSNVIVQWRRTLKLPPTSPLSSTSPDGIPAERLTEFVRRIHAVLARYEADKPKRADIYARLFRAADPRGELMPADLVRRQSKQFAALEKYMNDTLHHDPTPTREDFEEKLGVCERIFREMLQPPARESQKAIDEILGRK